MRSRLYDVIQQKVLHQQIRNLSFLKKFCKKDDNTIADKSVEICLENVFKLYNLENEPEDTVCLKTSEALLYYRQMQQVRRLETATAALYRSKEIRGFCHLYTGQEGCAIGIKAAMRPVDTVITSYRSHGWTYLMDVTSHSIIAELIQKQTGCSRGRGGSMHMYSKNFFGGNGIVGAQVPLGVGIALAHAYRCDGGVCFTLYGDGASNQGQVFEAYNMACLWHLPVIFVCENNKYGMGTSAKRSSCNADYYTRGDYIPGLWVDGMDVLAVRSATEFAINYATTNGPLVLECETYRYSGHSMSDPGASYRKREEVEEMRKTKDPITNFKNLCIHHKLLTEDDFKKIDNEVKLEIDKAVEQAKADPYPESSELCADVYLANYEKRIRGLLYYNLEHKNVGTPTIPLGTAKPTPKSEINDPPPPPPPPPSPPSSADKKGEATKKDDKKDAKKDVKKDDKKDVKKDDKACPKSVAKSAAEKPDEKVDAKAKKKIDPPSTDNKGPPKKSTDPPKK